MFRYANPAKFMALSGAVLPYVWAATAILFAMGLYWTFTAPPDYQQGDTVRILFIHVPAAMMAISVYATIAISSFFSLVWRHPLADVAARSAAPIGALFTALFLIDGSLWGKPMWGTYWAWDPRLTSSLLLLFIYFGYMALWNAIEDETRAGRAAAILALVGSVDLPIIHYSVNWWNTLHQGESIMTGAIDPVFRPALFSMMLAFAFLFAALWMTRIRTGILERRIRTLMQAGGA